MSKILNYISGKLSQAAASIKGSINSERKKETNKPIYFPKKVVVIFSVLSKLKKCAETKLKTKSVERNLMLNNFLSGKKIRYENQSLSPRSGQLPIYPKIKSASGAPF